MKAPVFICGHRKSGTTMLFNLFDGHPDLMVFPSDLNILYAYYPIYTDDKYNRNERLDRLERVIFTDIQDQFSINNKKINFDMELFRQQFFNSIEAEDLNNIKSLITSLIESFAKVTNQTEKIPVVKETSIEIYASELKRYFPEAKFIHLIRDPRDNYAALKSGVKVHYKHLGEDENKTLASMIYRSRFGLEMGLLNQKIFGGRSYKTVKFETLVKQTEGLMVDISEYLEIDYHKNLLQPTSFSEPVKGNNFDGKTFSKVSTKNLNRWTERIHSTEAKIIEFQLGSLMEQYGYKLNYERSESANAASEFYKWENYKYYFSDRFK
jgi:hypothetical protein